MKAKALVGTVMCCLLSFSAMAQQPPVATPPEQAVKDVETLVKAKAEDRNIGDLKLKRTRLENELAGLKAKAVAASASAADKNLYARAVAALAEAKKILDPSVADFIKGTKPMTAVLFSNQDRNSFEVVKDPKSMDATLGIINQNQAGSTGGILIAAEAPFAYPTKPLGIFKRKKNKTEGKGNRVYPIGAWFGVNLKTGAGDEVSDVSLAAGLSFSLISAEKLSKLEKGEGAGVSGSARFLLGAVYGEVATLGPMNATEDLTVGDEYPLGESLPLHKDKKLSVACGIGFRF